MIATHSLPAAAFAELAAGGGDSEVARQLRAAQLSKHLMLLHVVAEAAARADASPATIAFHAGYQLLAEVQAARPDVAARLLGLPHIGSWAHDCLACLDNGSQPDFGYLAAAAAAAAARAGTPFELDVPVRDGRVLLPGLGCLSVAGEGEWIRLHSDGRCLRAGGQFVLPCDALVPDDGSGSAVPQWTGTPLARAVADGRTWEVLIEVSDPHLDRYTLPMLTAMAADEATEWRQLIQASWELLVRNHEWAARPLAVGVEVIVPLVPRSDLDSATSPAAFGAIAASLPPSAVSMAETLVHEFQHIKLCGLMDMLPLIEPGGGKGYAPWREDPRPVGGILQGLYAFAGIARFWEVQRRLEAEPDSVLHASVLYERWRLVIEPVARALLGTALLTPAGTRLVTILSEQGQRREFAPVPAEANEIAREVALDNWLTWQLSHVAVDAEAGAGLAAAYQRGERLANRTLPETRVEADVRKVDSAPRSRLLHMRYQAPHRYRELSAVGIPELGAGDSLLILGDAGAAIAAYQEEVAAGPDPAAWIGLALAVHRSPASSVPTVFAVHLPLLYEMHTLLAAQGISADPLDLAAWFA